MINTKNLAVSDRNVNLLRLLKAGLTHIVFHKVAPAKVTLKFNYDRLSEFRPTSVVWVDEDSNGVLSMTKGLEVAPLPGFIKNTGSFDAGNDVVHMVHVTGETADYVYDGVIYDDVHEDIVRKKIAENTSKSRKFFLNDISLLTLADDACATFVCKEASSMPDNAELCPDISELEPHDVVYIQHRNGIIACTFISKFYLIYLKDVRNIVNPTAGEVYLIRDNGEVIMIVDEYGTPDTVAFWNETCFDVDNMHILEDTICNTMYE